MKKDQREREIKWLLKEKYGIDDLAGLALLKPHRARLAKQDLKRLKTGEPLAYVIGFVDFLGCKIDLSKKILIPSPETEFWTQKAVEEIKQKSHSEKIRCLDVFAGSGCVGIAVIRNSDNVLCDFIEKDRRALSQIKINCRLNKISKKKYQVFQSDIFSKFNKKKGKKLKYDYIFANPPYIPTLKKLKIQKSVLRYEPKQALFGGKDGLFFINKFLREAREYLKEQGTIYMEFDYAQKKDIETFLKKYEYQEWDLCKDQYDKYRYAVIK